MLQKNKCFPDFNQSVVLCFLLIVFSLLINFCFTSFFEIEDKTMIMIWMNIPVFFIVFLIAIYFSEKPMSFYIKNREIEFRFYLPIFFIALGAIILIGEISNLVFYFYPMPGYLIEEFNVLLSSEWGIVSAIFVAAITEEFFFRGLILTGLNHNNNFWASIILSSLLFGMIHMLPWQVIPAFFGGILLGWLYLKFKSLKVCIFIHALNNALAAIPVYYDFEIPGIIYNLNKGVQFHSIWINIFGLVLLLLGLKLINKKM